ncbi:hypothetical protein BDF22DRAFT_635885 [Syncephalis plumigaleata]|nr:hypothetical protein BDF22DRAFT_635885 [Syncephalis plumigaleata]
MVIGGTKELNVLVLGGTGAVGSALVRELLQSKAFARVTAAGRRPVPYDGPNADRLQQVTLDYERLLAETKETESSGDHSQSKLLEGYDIVFCSLGTTHKQAGSDEAFRRIDRDYVLAAAQEAKRAGCRHFLYVSSANANASSLFLYPRTKGETERGLKELDFPRLSIYRPGFLVPEKPREGPSRPMESFAINWVMPCLTTIFGEARLQAPVEVVARAMIRDAANTASADGSADVHIAEVIDNRTILETGRAPLETN